MASMADAKGLVLVGCSVQQWGCATIGVITATLPSQLLCLTSAPAALAGPNLLPSFGRVAAACQG